MYKIVKIEGDKKVSLCQEDYKVEYIPNQITLPPISLPESKLFVFDTIDSVNEFLIKNRHLTILHYEIWECEVENPVIADFIASDDGYYVRSFWANFADVNEFSHGSARPGTIFVDSVKLTELVRKHDASL